MAKKKNEAFPVYDVLPGRLLRRDGRLHLMIAVPAAFFNKNIKTGEPMASATQDEADRLTDRIAYLLTEYGE